MWLCEVEKYILLAYRCTNVNCLLCSKGAPSMWSRHGTDTLTRTAMTVRHGTARNLWTQNILTQHVLEHLEHETNLVPLSGTKPRGRLKKQTALSAPGSRTEIQGFLFRRKSSLEHAHRNAGPYASDLSNLVCDRIQDHNITEYAIFRDVPCRAVPGSGGSVP